MLITRVGSHMLLPTRDKCRKSLAFLRLASYIGHVLCIVITRDVRVRA